MIRERLIRNATRSRALLVCLGLVAAVLAAYATSFGNGPVWDDRPLVVDNPFLGTLSGLGRLWSTDLWTASAQGEPSSFYRPFTMVTFWGMVAVGGRSVVWLRLGNILIHAANALLLALFARRATGLGWRPAGLVALLFAVAPVCSEPVLWISGRFDLLVVTFALLALLASRIKGPLGLALVFASVAAGLLSKESFTGWLPLLLIDDLFLRRAGRVRELLPKLLPKYIAVAAATAAYLALRKMVGIPSLDVVTGTGVRPFVESFLLLIGSFFRQLVWPSTLDPFRPYAAPAALAMIAIVVTLAALVGAAALVFRHHRDAEAARVALFGVAWFVLATLPSAVAGPTLAMIGDRYAYLPLVGLFLAAAPLLAWLESRHERAPIVVSAVVAVLAVVWGTATAIHAPAWKDDRSLAESSLAIRPENPYALYLSGSEAARQGRLEEADALLARSLVGNPGAWRTWNAICYVRLNQNRLVEAEQACIETTRRHAGNPRAWVNLASVYVRAGRWKDALESAEHATELKPKFAEAHYLAGASAAKLRQYELAASHVDDGLAAEPAHRKLLVLQAELERHRGAAPLP